MTDKISSSVASAVSDVIEERKEERKSTFQYRCNHCGNEYPPGSHGPSICGTCGERMHIHTFSEADATTQQQIDDLNKDKQKIVVGADDVFINLGDLSTTELKDINTGGKNYEAITLDYIATFNHAVTQGVNPVKALLAMIQACAITMSNCLRANMKETVAFGMVAFIVNAAKKAKSEVKIITTEH